MELQKERFAISFNPRHRLLQVSLVVECGLGGGHLRRAEAPRADAAPDAAGPSAERRPQARRDRAARASRRLRRARAARQGH
jgi:hypothetical protein